MTPTDTQRAEFEDWWLNSPHNLSRAALGTHESRMHFNTWQAATERERERAAKVGFINGLDAAYNALFDIRGDKVTRFDSQTAIRKLKEAAAIREVGT